MNNTWCNILLGVVAALIGLLSFVDQFELTQKFVFLKSIGFKIAAFVLLSIIAILITIRKDKLSEKSGDKDARIYSGQIDSLKILLNSKDEIIEGLNLKADTLLELTRKKDYEIEELRTKSDNLVDKVNIINSAEIRVELDVPINSDIVEDGKSIGIYTAIYISDNKNFNLRFVTDGSYYNKRISKNYIRFYLSFKPEFSEQMIGKEITYITNFNKMTVYFPEFVYMTGNILSDGVCVVNTSVLVNNIELYKDKSTIPTKDFKGSLSSKIDLNKAKNLLLAK